MIPGEHGYRPAAYHDGKAPSLGPDKTNATCAQPLSLAPGQQRYGFEAPPDSAADRAENGLPDEACRPPLVQPTLLSIADVEAIFGRRQRTIRRWIKQGKLPAVRVGRSVFIRSGDVTAVINSSIVDSLLKDARVETGMSVSAGNQEKISAPEGQNR